MGKGRAARNAEIWAGYDSIKKQRDRIITKGSKVAHKNTIIKLTGQVMGDMIAESRRMIMKWKKTETKVPNDPRSAFMRDTIEGISKIWLVIYVWRSHGDAFRWPRIFMQQRFITG
jgi:hypothetical protein